MHTPNTDKRPGEGFHTRRMYLWFLDSTTNIVTHWPTSPALIGSVAVPMLPQSRSTAVFLSSVVSRLHQLARIKM